MAAVQLIPKMQAAEAMAFTYDNLGEVIQWLGSDFYALTDGSPVNLNGSTVRSNFVNEDGTRTQPFDQCLVIAFRNGNDLAITSIGHYIIRDPVLGYRVSCVRRLWHRGGCGCSPERSGGCRRQHAAPLCDLSS